MVLPVGSGFSQESLAKSLLQLSTAGAETQRRNAMRFMDIPLRYHKTALTFIASGLPRGVVRVN
jgi:hypothetical protein